MFVASAVNRTLPHLAPKLPPSCIAQTPEWLPARRAVRSREAGYHLLEGGRATTQDASFSIRPGAALPYRTHLKDSTM